MKIRVVLCVLCILAVSICVFAADTPTEKPAIDLPRYPGAEVSMEVNLTSEDLIPTLKSMLPLLMANVDKGSGVNPDEVADAFKNVKRIQMFSMDAYKSEDTEASVSKYFSKNLPSGNWNRVFWQSSKQQGNITVYAQPGAEGLYAFRVRSNKSDEGKLIKRVEVVKIDGKIDFAKLLPIAIKMFSGR